MRLLSVDRHDDVKLPQPAVLLRQLVRERPPRDATDDDRARAARTCVKTPVFDWKVSWQDKEVPSPAAAAARSRNSHLRIGYCFTVIAQGDVSRTGLGLGTPITRTARTAKM